MAVLGLDIGTSTIKAAVLDLDAVTITQVRRVPFPDPIPGLPPLHKTFDPAVVLNTARTLLEPLAAQCAPCEALLVCSQMHNLVWVDETGQARSPLCTWQDQRSLEPHPAGGSIYDVLLERLTAEQRHELGNELRPGHPISVLFWHRVRDLLPTDPLIPAAIGDYVVAALCGVRPVTELTNAHAHGLLDVAAGRWHTGVIRALGLEGVRLPEIRPPNAIVGYWTLGDQRIPCYPPIGDFQAALVGALLEDGELSANIATGSQVSLLRQTRAAPAEGGFQTRPYLDDRRVITVTTIPAGRSLNALLDLLTELPRAQGVPMTDPWETILGKMASVDDPDLRVNLSFFESAVGKRGAITDIREDELTIGHLFRAAFRNMADNYLECALRLSPERAWRRLVFSGGIAHRVALLRDLMAERFRVPQRMSPSHEDTLLGLLVRGLVVTGRAHDLPTASAQVAAHFAPQ